MVTTIAHDWTWGWDARVRDFGSGSSPAAQTPAWARGSACEMCQNVPSRVRKMCRNVPSRTTLADVKCAGRCRNLPEGAEMRHLRRMYKTNPFVYGVSRCTKMHGPGAAHRPRCGERRARGGCCGHRIDMRVVVSVSTHSARVTGISSLHQPEIKPQRRRELFAHELAQFVTHGEAALLRRALRVPAEPEVGEEGFLLTDVGDVEVAFEVALDGVEVAQFQGGHRVKQPDAAARADGGGKGRDEAEQLLVALRPQQRLATLDRERRDVRRHPRRGDPLLGGGCVIARFAREHGEVAAGPRGGFDREGSLPRRPRAGDVAGAEAYDGEVIPAQPVRSTGPLDGRFEKLTPLGLDHERARVARGRARRERAVVEQREPRRLLGGRQYF